MRGGNPAIGVSVSVLPLAETWQKGAHFRFLPVEDAARRSDLCRRRERESAEQGCALPGCAVSFGHGVGGLGVVWKRSAQPRRGHLGFGSGATRALAASHTRLRLPWVTRGLFHLRTASYNQNQSKSCRIPTHVQHRARSLRLSTNRPDRSGDCAVLRNGVFKPTQC